MTERENILARVREALRNPAPRPGAHEASHATEALEQPISRWLPKVGNSFEEQLDLFKSNAEGLKAVFHMVKDQEEMVARLGTIRDAEGWKRAATHKGHLTDAVAAKLGLPTILTDAGYDVNSLEQSDVGITECDALIAQTGSVLVTSKSAGGRALSVLPPHHVVLARKEQLMADLPGAFDLLTKRYGTSYPSFISFITGPSRTGDIERILVLGAHGPKKLTILCF